MKKSTKSIFLIIRTLIFVIIILGTTKITLTNGLAAGLKNQGDDQSLQLTQGSLIHGVIRKNKPLTITLEVKSPKIGAVYSWAVLQPPPHGEAVITVEEKHASVRYIPKPDFTGEDFFQVLLTDSKGNKARIDIVVTIDPQPFEYARSISEGNEERNSLLSSPHIEVHPLGDCVFGSGFSENSQVILTIGSNQWIGESDSSGWVYISTYPFDIQANQIIEITDGVSTLSHTVRYLSINEFNESTDLISGVTAPGTGVEVIAGDVNNNSNTLYLTANSSGQWLADFSGSVDITFGSYGWVSQYDGVGNSTCIYWEFFYPYIRVEPLEEQVTGYDFIAHTTVTLTIGAAQWSAETDESGWVSFDTNPFDIQAGQVVTMTDGTSTCTHFVRYLTVTEFDWDADIIGGSATPGSEVSSSAFFTNNTVTTHYSTADESGHWQADFSGETDITAGAFGWANQFDTEGDYTSIYWQISNPHMRVNPGRDTVQGYEFAENSEITLSIGATQWTAETDQDGVVLIYTAPFDIQPGMIVTMTDGIATRSHFVTHLAITNIDQDADLITGTATPGQEIFISAVEDLGNWIALYPIANGSGQWQADFSGLVEIAAGSYGWGLETDTGGSATEIFWQVSDPWILTFVPYVAK